jgi:hypothetical protein
VVVTGTNLTGATAVKFGTASATSYTVNSASQITAVSPAGSAGTVNLRVTTSVGTSATSSSDDFTYEAAPTVTVVSPTSGSTAGGTTVLITGTNLTGATAVKFGTTSATSYTVNSATSITAVSPAESAATVDITVTTPVSTSVVSSADDYTYVPSPAVTSVVPDGGPVSGGTPVTITGANFTAATAVKFGTTSATSYTVNSATSITAVSPAHTSGTVDIIVTNSYGTSAASAADHFTFEGSPTVTSVSPISGPVSGGTSVTIKGTDLTGAIAVSFGFASATTYTVSSATQIIAISPAGSTGTVNVTVTTPVATSATLRQAVTR